MVEWEHVRAESVKGNQLPHIHERRAHQGFWSTNIWSRSKHYYYITGSQSPFDFSPDHQVAKKKGLIELITIYAMLYSFDSL